MRNLLQNNKLLFIVLSLLFFKELLFTAWLSDDAQITLRTVLNFLHGYGPTYNIDERVQAFTHPLWFLSLSLVSFATKNIFIATFVLSMGISLLAFWLFLNNISKKLPNIIITAWALMLSKAYIDFSTSGLENPLSHLLIILLVIFATHAARQKQLISLIVFFFTCSLLYLNRADLLILISPLGLYIIFKNIQTPKIVIQALLISLLPVITWTLFSLYYYGFLFPNTAYAKLATGIPFSHTLHQGFAYLLNAIHKDTLTPAVILLGMIIGICTSGLNACLALGIFLYLLYVVSVGGDFMAGRFLTEAFLLSAIIIVRAKINKIQLSLLAIIVSSLGAITINSTFLSGKSYQNHIIKKGIADERGFYFKHHGLLNTKLSNLSSPEWILKTRKTEIVFNLGGVGISSGPNVHLIDRYALADPLLARLEIEQPHGGWRIGHFVRDIPVNYPESVERNKNLLTDPALHAYYDVIREITRGDLNDIDRWKKIILINTGQIKAPKIITQQNS